MTMIMSMHTRWKLLNRCSMSNDVAAWESQCNIILIRPLQLQAALRRYNQCCGGGTGHSHGDCADHTTANCCMYHTDSVTIAAIRGGVQRAPALLDRQWRRSLLHSSHTTYHWMQIYEIRNITKTWQPTTVRTNNTRVCRRNKYTIQHITITKCMQ